MAPSQFVFAALDSSDVAISTRLSVLPFKRVSVDVFAQAYVATGRYTDFKQLSSASPSGFLRYGSDIGTISHDAASNEIEVQPSAGSDWTAFRFANPDFSPALVDLRSVARWDWRRGSTLYVVWTHGRVATADAAGMSSISAALNGRPTNVWAVKATYWFSH